MNIAEFNTEMGKLLERAMAEGVAHRKMTIVELMGSFELQKAELVRGMQDMARAAAQAKKGPHLYVPDGTIAHPKFQ